MQRSTECGILHFSVSWYCLCRHGLRSEHIRMYTLVHTYMLCTIHFNAILRALIFFVLFLPDRVTHILRNLLVGAYYLHAVVFLPFRCINILYYLYLVVPLKFGRIRYVSPLFLRRYDIYLVVLLAAKPDPLLLTYVRRFVSTVRHRVSREAIRRKYPLIVLIDR